MHCIACSLLCCSCTNWDNHIPWRLLFYQPHNGQYSALASDCVGEWVCLLTNKVVLSIFSTSSAQWTLTLVAPLSKDVVYTSESCLLFNLSLVVVCTHSHMAMVICIWLSSFPSGHGHSYF